MPNIVPCRAVLDFVLKAFGCDGSVPLFYFWRVVMIIYWLCLCMNSAVSPTYRDRAADPQRPYLSSLHALECVVQLLEGGMAVYCHGVLFGLKTTGQIDRILDSTSALHTGCTPAARPLHTGCTPTTRPLCAHCTPAARPPHAHCAPTAHRLHAHCAPTVRTPRAARSHLRAVRTSLTEFARGESLD